MQVQCMRSKGWKRFLLFAELTKNRKGADYVALFVHFEFSAAIRLLFADTGRQVVNAVTLWSLTSKYALPTGEHAAPHGTSPFIKFWNNLGEYFKQDWKTAVVFCTMLFTLVIFVFCALSLIAALICYLAFLWHYIPQSDGRLGIYCKRKIDQRLTKIVGEKVKEAVSKDNVMSIPTDRFGDYEKAGVKRQPTLPDLDLGPGDSKSRFGIVTDDSASSVHSFGSKNSSPTKSVATLRTQPSLPNIEPGPPFHRPGFPGRSDTMGTHTTYSAKSYESNAPLLRNANGMGHSEPPYPMQQMPRGPPAMNMAYNNRPPPGSRSNTPGSMRSFSSQAAFHGPPMPPPPQQQQQAMRSFSGAHPAASGLASSQQGSLDRSMTATPRAAELAGGSPHDSFTREMSRSSFNRPFVRQDRPNISPTSSSTSQRAASPAPSQPQQQTANARSYTPFNPNLVAPRSQSPLHIVAYGQTPPPANPAMQAQAGPPMRRNVSTPSGQPSASYAPSYPQQDHHPVPTQRSVTDPSVVNRRF